MTLNGVMAVILRHCIKFGSVWSQLPTLDYNLIEVRPTLSLTKM